MQPIRPSKYSYDYPPLSKDNSVTVRDPPGYLPPGSMIYPNNRYEESTLRTINETSEKTEPKSEVKSKSKRDDVKPRGSSRRSRDKSSRSSRSGSTRGRGGLGQTVCCGLSVYMVAVIICLVFLILVVAATMAVLFVRQRNYLNNMPSSMVSRGRLSLTTRRPETSPSFLIEISQVGCHQQAPLCSFR
jgi:hypothetical protein